MERVNRKLVSAFAEVLKEARQSAGLSQEELAERAEVSVRFVSFLETGRRQPSLSAISAVSSGLGVDMTALIGAVEKQLHMKKG